MQPGCRDAACRVISLAGDSTQNTQIMNLVLVAARPSFCTQIITDLEGFFYLRNLLNLREKSTRNTQNTQNDIIFLNLCRSV